MKKAMWIIAFAVLIITAAVLRFMPDTVPAHYSIDGETDRWGSKYESLIFPAIILSAALGWHLAIRHCDNKAALADDDKKRKELLANSRVFSAAALGQTILFALLHFYFLYRAFTAAGGGTPAIEVSGVMCLLIGLMLMGTGPLMRKSKRNGAFGIRTKWSMHNDGTWEKTHTFGAYAAAVTGALLIAAGLLLDKEYAAAAMIAAIFCFAAVTAVYSYIVYKREVSDGNGV